MGWAQKSDSVYRISLKYFNFIGVTQKVVEVEQREVIEKLLALRILHATTSKTNMVTEKYSGF